MKEQRLVAFAVLPLWFPFNRSLFESEQKAREHMAFISTLGRGLTDPPKEHEVKRVEVVVKPIAGT